MEETLKVNTDRGETQTKGDKDFLSSVTQTHKM